MTKFNFDVDLNESELAELVTQAYENEQFDIISFIKEIDNNIADWDFTRQLVALGKEYTEQLKDVDDEDLVVDLEAKLDYTGLADVVFEQVKRALRDLDSNKV